MTKIYIHGKLSKFFGKNFSFRVSSVLFALKAIDANNEGFLKKLKELSDEGLNYFAIVNGKLIQNINSYIENIKIKTIYLIPAIAGSGGFVGAAVATGLGYALDSAAGIIISSVVSAVVNSAISLAVSFAVQAMTKSQSAAPQQNIAIGGAVSQIAGTTKSYIFSDKFNVVSQGRSVPVGYGRVYIGSLVIAASLRNYKVNESFQNASKTSNNFENLLNN